MEAVTLNPNMVIIGDLAYETTIIENKRHRSPVGTGNDGFLCVPWCIILL